VAEEKPLAGIWRW